MVPNLLPYHAAGARQVSAVVESIFKDAYADMISNGNLFDSANAFMQRFDVYTSRDSFDLVVGYQGDGPVEQIWGWPLDERARKGW